MSRPGDSLSSYYTSITDLVLFMIHLVVWCYRATQPEPCSEIVFLNYGTILWNVAHAWRLLDWKHSLITPTVQNCTSESNKDAGECSMCNWKHGFIATKNKEQWKCLHIWCCAILVGLHKFSLLWSLFFLTRLSSGQICTVSSLQPRLRLCQCHVMESVDKHNPLSACLTHMLKFTVGALDTLCLLFFSLFLSL